jgi:hypothetical protein
MTNGELRFLRAASELVKLQEPILAEFEETVGVSAYDYWIRRGVGRASAVAQTLTCGPWHYFFHGLELDVKHVDGRHLRIELGPAGITNLRAA